MYWRLTTTKHTYFGARQKALGGLGLFALCLAAAIYPDTSTVAQPVPPVETETVRESAVIRKLELSGSVSSPHASQISTLVEGLVSTCLLYTSDAADDFAVVWMAGVGG